MLHATNESNRNCFLQDWIPEIRASRFVIFQRLFNAQSHPRERLRYKAQHTLQVPCHYFSHSVIPYESPLFQRSNKSLLLLPCNKLNVEGYIRREINRMRAHSVHSLTSLRGASTLAAQSIGLERVQPTWCGLLQQGWRHIQLRGSVSALTSSSMTFTATEAASAVTGLPMATAAWRTLG